MSGLVSSARVIKVSLRETSSSFKHNHSTKSDVQASPSIHVSIRDQRNVDSVRYKPQTTKQVSVRNINSIFCFDFLFIV